MCLTFSYGRWLSLTVSTVPCSFYMSLIISYSSIELLNVSHCLSGPVGVAACLS